jgi:hypothetical protein
MYAGLVFDPIRGVVSDGEIPSQAAVVGLGLVALSATLMLVTAGRIGVEKPAQGSGP